MILRYTETGLLIIFPHDDPGSIVDAMLETDYCEEFCVSPDFSPDFIARLMDAGFLIMSAGLDTTGDTEESRNTQEPQLQNSFPKMFILLPKLHLSRSVLFFDNLHVKRSVNHLLGEFDLRYDSDFDAIVNRCLEIHGEDWLTPPLVSAIRDIRQSKLYGVYPVSFALYRDDKLVAGEFGVQVGRVYTSYSGYYDENNAGTVQLILAARYLQDHDFAFFDLGMPLDYKTDLGAVNISPEEFVRLFRNAQPVQ